MKTLMFVAIGTRGDVQPIVALGEALHDAGYPVVIVAGRNFQGWVESRGLHFQPLRVDMETMMNSPAGKIWADTAGKSPLAEGRAMRNMLVEFAGEITEDVVQFCPQADVLFSNLPTFGFIAAIAEKHHKPHIRVMFSPLTPTNDPRATMVPMVPGMTSPLNRLACYLGIYFTHWVAKNNYNPLRHRLGLKPWVWRDYARAWNTVPALTGISPLITPPDPRWGDQTILTGYWFSPRGESWQPPADLLDFLSAGDAPVYVGFGSMPNSEPERTTSAIFTALEHTGQRGIVHRGWASLGGQAVPKNVHLIDHAPHYWLFPRMKAVIHHGGAGTVATAVRAGVPQTVVSHLGDQPYWGRRIHELGIGARPIKRIHLDERHLQRAIEAMIGSPTMREHAAQFGAQFGAETGVQNAVKYVRRFLGDAG